MSPFNILDVLWHVGDSVATYSSTVICPSCVNRLTLPRQGKTFLCFIKRGKLIADTRQSRSAGTRLHHLSLLSSVFPPDKSPLLPKQSYRSHFLQRNYLFLFIDSALSWSHWHNIISSNVSGPVMQPSGNLCAPVGLGKVVHVHRL